MRDLIQAAKRIRVGAKMQIAKTSVRANCCTALGHELHYLKPGTAVTVLEVGVPCVRAIPCRTCGKRHEAFVLVEFPHRVALTDGEVNYDGGLERAAVHTCNLAGV